MRVLSQRPDHSVSSPDIVYYLNFKTINISILNVNTANERQLVGTINYRDFRERGPGLGNYHSASLHPFIL